MDLTRIVTALVLTASLSGGILAVADRASRDHIARNPLAAIETGIRTIAPDAEEIKEIDEGFIKSSAPAADCSDTWFWLRDRDMPDRSRCW